MDKSAYDKAGITIITHQRERDRFMLVDIALWELRLGNETPNLLAISKKIRKGSVFLSFLEELYSSCNVIGVATPHDASSSDLVLVDFESLYTSLLLGEGVQQPIIDQRESVQKDPKRMKLLVEEPLDYSHPPPPPLEKKILTEPPCVFFDNPRFLERHFIRYHMEQVLGFNGEFSAMACVVDLEEELVDDDYKKAGVIIIPPRAHIMSVDIVLWALENPATFFQPKTLVVYSDNVKEGTDLYNVLEALHYRYYNVFVFNRDGPVFYWPSINDKRIVSKEEFTNGLPSWYNHDYNFHSWPIHIFLNVQGCSTRKSGNLSSAILSGLRNKGYGGNVYFRPYLDMESGPVPQGKWDGYACLPSIKVEGDKSAIVTRMTLSCIYPNNPHQAPLSSFFYIRHILNLFRELDKTSPYIHLSGF